MKRDIIARIAAIAVLALVMTACAGGGDTETAAAPSDGSEADSVDDSEPEPTGAGTVPGVTEDTISLGVLADLTGPFAATSEEELQGIQIHWDAVNEEGGVCGRQVELVTRDHEYNPQQATTAFNEIAEEVLALQLSIGSPPTAAILPEVESQEMVAIASSNAAELLREPWLLELGASYDLEMINGLSWLLEEGAIAEGDTIGHVYFEGDYGEAALGGTEAFASEHDMEVVGQQITPDVTDLSSQLGTLADRGVSAIAVTSSVAQVASLASLAASLDLDIEILASSPAFSPGALDTEAGPAMEELVHYASSIAPLGSEDAGPTRLREAYGEQYPDGQPGAWVVLGNAIAIVMDQLLTDACEDGSLDRAAVYAAAEALGEVDTEGLETALDFSGPCTSSEESFLLRPDAETVGGLVVDGGPLRSESLADYDPCA